ncbi:MULTISPECIES: DNA primase [unclassified Thioalkalivibrio]|uniref:DNA primase n=1 Tax=unclassified Thioalkalivibrio TaxID=2621013 RepID=UPI00036DC29A|nr:MULTISPECIES: DNA primase [unclassified Thioalkalivibrio]
MAGLIPQAFIDELLERSDIVEVIQRRVSLKKAGREFAACCPFHGEKTPSFYVSPQKQFYHCFGCGAHGTAISFLMEYENLSFPEAVEQLAEQAGLEVPREAGADDKREAHAPLYEALNAAADYYVQQLRQTPKAVEYLKNRGIDGTTARDYQIGWAPPSGLIEALKPRFTPQQLVEAGLAARRDDGGIRERFRARIMFPIRDRRGRITGFGGRLIEDGEPKYLNSPESEVFHKGQTIYGLFEARKAGTRLDDIVVVEGYMDVLGLARAGFRRAVACMGTALTRAHLDSLFRQVSRITLCFDGDAAGRRAAWRSLAEALPAIQGLREVRVLFLPEGDDPDSLVLRDGLADWEERLTGALPLSETLVRLLREEHPTETAEGRTRFAHAAMKLVSTTRDPLFRDQLVERVAQETHLSPERLGEQLREAEDGNARATGPVSAPADIPDAPSAEPAGAAQETPSALWGALLARILQHPELEWSQSELADLTAFPGTAAQTLGKLLGALQERPGCSSAHLLERFRDDRHFNRLQALAARELGDGDPKVTQQVAMDCARQLLLQQARTRIRELTRADGGLTTEQREELARLSALLQKRNPG